MSESKISILNHIFLVNYKKIIPSIFIINISFIIPLIIEIINNDENKNKLIILENILLKKPYYCCFICFFILLIQYTFLIFMFNDILGIDLSKESIFHEKLFSKSELIYSSPICFIILVYLCEELDLSNPIDFCFTYLIGLYHLLSTTFIIKFLEVKIIKNDKDLLIEYLFNIIITISTIIFTTIIYISISKCDNNIFKYVILSKGIYIILKIIEIITIRHTAYYVSLITYDEKESWLIAILKRKTHLGLISRLFLFYKFSIILIYGKKNCIIGYFFVSLMCLFLGFRCVKDYRIYEAQKDFYRCLMGNPDNNCEEKCNDTCEICMKKLIKGKKLQCGHSLHLVCICELFKQGKRICPICGKNIIINQSPLLKYNGNERINNANYVINLPMLFRIEIEVNFDDDIC